MVYDSLPVIKTSDHLPVYAVFHVTLRGASRKAGEAGCLDTCPLHCYE